MVALEHAEWKYAVLAGHGGARGTVTNRMAKYPWPEACELQGLPSDFDIPPFKVQWKYEALGNGVPMAMGRAVAQAVRKACLCAPGGKP
jgi:DNA (cytosine-5)-methyltransferase 1